MATNEWVKAPPSRQQVSQDWQPQVNRQPYPQNSAQGLPVSKWKLEKFGGREEELPRFLANVRNFAMAEGASKDEVFRSRIHLFKDDAADFVATAAHVENWEELVLELTRFSLGSISDADILRKIDKKVQRSESCAIFITRLELMFESLRNPITEQEKVEIAIRGLRPTMRQALAGSANIRSLPQLRIVAQRAERLLEDQTSGRGDVTPSEPQNHSSFNRSGSLNRGRRDYQKQDRKIRDKATEKCYRCGQEGHYQGECPKTNQIACHLCGNPGVLSRDCQQCQGKGQGRS